MFGSGHKRRRTTPTAELSEVVTTSLALTFQRLAATATILPSATATAYGSRPTLILSPYDQATTEDNYIGYYADIDDNGTVDGVIYADLAHAKSGEWDPGNAGAGWGIYSYSGVTSGLKEYKITGEHTESNSFGTKPVVAPVNKEDTRADRFYVMALKDVGTTTYYWYHSASGKLDKTVATDYNDFGDGRENTEYVMNKWTNSLWGSQNSRDMCGAIQTEVNNGWFVASKSEWAAFGGAFSITSGNYGNYGLSDWYWSSSQYGSSSAYYANFNTGCIICNGVNDYRYVRLSATF